MGLLCLMEVIWTDSVKLQNYQEITIIYSLNDSCYIPSLLKSCDRFFFVLFFWCGTGQKSKSLFTEV